jgi:CHAT domain
MSSDGAARQALALAEKAYALVEVSPRRALSMAERALAAAGDTDPEAQIVALHALAWAQLQLGDARTLDTVQAGIRAAERHSDHRGAGLLRRRLAYTYALAGETRAARRELEAAIALLEGPDRVRSEVFRLDIHRRAHAADSATHREVLARASTALRALRRAGDEIWEARMLQNRGLLLTDRGELDAAEADHRRAYMLYSRLGAEAAALDQATAIADLSRLRGDLLTCLQTLDEIQAKLPPGHFSYNIALCRAAALTEARLIPEARAATQAYVDLCARAGFKDELAKARLELARIALLAGDPATAAPIASTAARSFAARGSPINAALARGVWLDALRLSGDLRGSSVRSGLQAAAVLEHAGWRRDSLRMRLLVARIALEMGSLTTARRQLALAEPLRTTGTVTDRIELLHVRALIHLQRHEQAAAERLLGAGLRLLDEYRAVFGAAELRVTASGIGSELSQRGLEIALVSGRPAKILAWAERLRANALRLPAVRPPNDAKLRTLQAELRRTAAQVRAAEETGKPAHGIASRQAKLEFAVRARTLTQRGSGTAMTQAPDRHAAALALGDRALIEYVEVAGELVALSLVERRLVFHELGAAEATAELEWLRFALGRLARGTVDASERTAALASADAAAKALEQMLIEPLRSRIEDRPLVVVPTGSLHMLPWSQLPSLRRRPVSVSPSLGIWLDLATRPRSRRGGTALVAGPRLRHATAEVRALAALHPDATVLYGKAATVQASLAALESAALAHLACHGHFRSDSPLFSALELADGPLDVYQLQRLRRAPELVVLSACDLAISGVHSGDELLGLAAALLGLGTRTIVASIVPVPDSAARRMMLTFHRELLSGASAATALSRAQGQAEVAGFVCLGSSD